MPARAAAQAQFHSLSEGRPDHATVARSAVDERWLQCAALSGRYFDANAFRRLAGGPKRCAADTEAVDRRTLHTNMYNLAASSGTGCYIRQS